MQDTHASHSFSIKNIFHDKWTSGFFILMRRYLKREKIHTRNKKKQFFNFNKETIV